MKWSYVVQSSITKITINSCNVANSHKIRLTFTYFRVHSDSKSLSTIFAAVYMLCSMAVVALTVISSVVVTNIYQNNISNWVKSLLLKSEDKPEAKDNYSPDSEDRDVQEGEKRNETIDTEKFYKELSFRVDRGLFYIWLMIYVSCSAICIFLISL